MYPSKKTHQGVLPQPLALESVSADTPGVGPKRGTDAALAAPGMQHGRGETGAGIGASETSPDGNLNSHHERELVPKGKPAQRVTTVMVAVLGRDGKPLMPTGPSRARRLLKSRRARVHSIAPVFTIRLIDRTASDGNSIVNGVELGIDPGSRHTGIAVFTSDTRDDKGTPRVKRRGLASVQLDHRGREISKKLTSRAQLRRGRRTRNLRYRSPRFLNRPKPEGWLAPSLRHRVDTTMSMICKLNRILPISVIHQELVRFDTQQLQNPEIRGTEYQQGTLAGYEVREYLLAKFDRRCVYCGETGAPLNIDHVRPKAHGGSNRVSNLVLACIPCNQRKKALPVEEFVTDRTRLARILRWVKVPLKDAAAVNATRWSLLNSLKATGFAVRTGSGGLTKYNRLRSGLPKMHAIDALAVGNVDFVATYPAVVTIAKATGRGTYKRTIPNAYGFPRLKLTRTKRHFGFATGDTVRAVVPAGKKAGTHIGRVVVRKSGSFNIATSTGTIQGIHHRHCQLLRRGDGWHYITNGGQRGSLSVTPLIRSARS